MAARWPAHYEAAVELAARTWPTEQEIVDHTDAFFVNQVLLRLAESLRDDRRRRCASRPAEGVVLHPPMLLPAATGGWSGPSAPS